MKNRTPQVAIAGLPLDGKNEDAGLAKQFGDRYLLAVADGLTHTAGGVAARAVIGVLKSFEKIPKTARSLYRTWRAALPGLGEAPESRTTLTCGLLSCRAGDGGTWLTLDFFAIGDSPVWRVVRAPAGDRYTFQRYALHGGPYPAETGKVYGTVQPHHCEPVMGTVAFGRVEVPPGDVLVICTDGVPEREVFVRDHAEALAGGMPSTLCHWLFSTAPYADDALETVLRGYAARGVLYDDATIIAIRANSRKNQTSRSVSAAAPQ